MKWFENLSLVGIVLISWGIALFEYFFQVPANRLGFRENGGPFSLVELKVIQEAITLVVFMLSKRKPFVQTISLDLGF